MAPWASSGVQPASYPRATCRPSGNANYIRPKHGGRPDRPGGQKEAISFRAGGHERPMKSRAHFSAPSRLAYERGLASHRGHSHVKSSKFGPRADGRPRPSRCISGARSRTYMNANGVQGVFRCPSRSISARHASPIWQR